MSGNCKQFPSNRCEHLPFGYALSFHVNTITYEISLFQRYCDAIKEMLSLIIRVMAHDMPSKSSNPSPGSTVLFHNHCPKSSAPCHRHLACFFTMSHSLRSCNARFGHNPNALLPSSASAGTTLINIEHAHQVQACHFLPSAVLAYRPKPMSICISLLYFLPIGRLFFHLCHATLTNFSLPYLLNEL